MFYKYNPFWWRHLPNITQHLWAIPRNPHLPTLWMFMALHGGLMIFLKNQREHNYFEDLGRAGNRICGVYSPYRTCIIQDMSSFQIYIYIYIYIHIYIHLIV